MKSLILGLVLIMGCATKNVPAAQSKGPMLVMGDSISYGYAPYISQDWDVSHADHGQNSVYGAAHIQQWLDEKPRWALCTLNHGIWDIMDNAYVPVDHYAENLALEIAAMREKCDRVMFVTTTDFEYSPNRDPSEIPAYNAAAKAVMAQENIPVCDIYKNNTLYSDDGSGRVHFTEEGNRLNGVAVSECIGKYF